MSLNELESFLQNIKEQGLFRTLRTVGSKPGAEIEIDGRRVSNFCSNDYLGLAGDERLAKAAAEAALRYGAGSGSARLISGNSPLCEELESALAALKGTETALLFNSGYHANIGVLPALATEGVIFSDELNHASLIDGCRLAKAETVVYRHNDLDHLEDLLKKKPGRKLIVTEAVFSMEGDVCPLDDLMKLAARHDALIYLDEAHAVGVCGQDGEGLASRPPENLVCMGTLGKAFGSYGAFVAGTKTLRDYLINTARSFIFTTGLPPSVLGASIEAVRILRQEPQKRQRLWQNVSRLKGVSPIRSVRIGPADKTMEVSKLLFKEGFFLQGIRPPTVPEGTSRLRLTVSALHGAQDIERLRSALNRLGYPLS